MKNINQNYVNELRKESEDNILSIFVYDEIFISETVVVDLIVARITTWQAKSKKGGPIVSVEEYRQLLGDFTSSSERIEERVQYLESFCRNIIRPELKKIYEQSKENIIPKNY